MENRIDDLFLRFQMKGFLSIEIPGLVKDVLDILGNGGYCTITTLEQELEDLGWGIGILDYKTYELITSLVEGNVS